MRLHSPLLRFGKLKRRNSTSNIHIDGGSNLSVTPSLELLDNITDIYLKNKLPHAAHGFKKNPFECLTGLKPDLSTLKVWGCKLLARKPGKRPAKLDHHTSEGIFLNYTATSKNVVYLDINTGREKIASNVVFDEANFSDGSGSPGAHALHRAGTRTFQSNLDIPTQSEAVHTDTTNNQAFQVHVDHALTIPPFQTVHLTTGVHTQDEQSFCHVEYHIGNPLIQLQHFITINNGKFECFIGLTNTTPIPILLSAEQRIGNITTANDAFVNISHHDGVTTSPLATSTPPPTFAPIPHPPPNQARPVSPEPIEEPILRQFSSPIESIIFSTNPHGHQLDITCKIKGDDELLGMELDNYSNYHQLKLLHCKKGTPMARIPKWRLQLRNAIVYSYDGHIITTIDEPKNLIRQSRDTGTKEVKITFLTPLPIPVRPQEGLPQLFFDQLHIIAQHLDPDGNDILATHSLANENCNYTTNRTDRSRTKTNTSYIETT